MARTAGADMGTVREAVGVFFDEGRVLLFVSTSDAVQEEKALDILSRHGAFNPKIYTVGADQ